MDWYGANAGGVAYVDVFGDPFYFPAFIFPVQLNGGAPKVVWEAIRCEGLGGRGAGLGLA